MKENELLSLGTIVELKSISNYVMIIGINQASDGQTYDYSGCVHPYGYIDSEQLVLFNYSEIEKVIFEGYSDEVSKDYFDDIIWMRNKKKEEGK